METHRKKLAALSYSDIDYCTYLMMKHWCSQPREELDEAFVHDLRDLKLLILGDRDIVEDLTNTVAQKAAQEITNVSLLQSYGVMKTVIRNLLTIGANLPQSKELRDLLYDLVDKVVDPLKEERWPEEHVLQFFNILAEVYPKVASVRDTDKRRYNSSFDRFIICIQLCVTRLYSVVPV